MAIVGPETPWQKFKKTPAAFDVLGGIVTAGSLFATAARFFATGSPRWGGVSAGLAVLALAIQGLKARRTYQDAAKKDSIHELQGCLHTLETTLLGPDLDPPRRSAAGLRLTIQVPSGKGSLKQALPYVGDRRTGDRNAGRPMLENVGVAGQAFRQAQLNPDAPQLFAGSRTTQDHDAFLKQMVTDYGFSQDDALNLSQSTMSWLAFAIARNGTVYGVLYCDSKQADFFTDERKEDLLHAMVGIAYFVGLRYP